MKRTKRIAAVLCAAIAFTFLTAMFSAITGAAAQVLSADFEDGTAMSFDVRGTEAEKAAGTGVLTAVTEEARSGQYSLLITERKQAWNGPAISVANSIVPDASCEISVWVLPKSPDSSTFKLSTQIGEGGSAEYINLDSKTASYADGWTELTAEHSYASNEGLITVYVENETPNVEFYIDDFSFTVSGEAWNPSIEPLTNNKLGEYDGFNFELWKNDRNDDARMDLTGGGTFACRWENAFALFRTGKRLGSVKTYGDYGDIILEYAAEHNITKGNVSYLCMYGWTEDPMIEFYIVENHGSYKPPGGKGFKGTYDLDGGTYEVYVDTRVEQPSIQGTKTFEQYFAVRTDLRTEGTLTVSEHFKEWEKLGLDMSGELYEVSLCIEGYMGSGNASVYKHVLTIGDTVYGADTVPRPVKPDAPESAAETTASKSAETSADETPDAATDIRDETTESSAEESVLTQQSDESDFNPALIIGIAAAVIIIIVGGFLLNRKKKDG